MKKIAGIYRILNTVTLKSYIGYSTGIYSRWKNHKQRLRLGTHKNKHLQASWDIYKEPMFHFSIIEELPIGLSKKEYEEVETKWVLYYNSCKEGYNQAIPGVYTRDVDCIRKKRVTVNEIISIEILTGTIKEYTNCKLAQEELHIDAGYIRECTYYWKNLTKCNRHDRKSYKGYIFIKKKDYNPNFNYINYYKPKTYKKK